MLSKFDKELLRQKDWQTLLEDVASIIIANFQQLSHSKAKEMQDKVQNEYADSFRNDDPLL